ncbi:hypothetical protein RN001_014681 [Aquatica leii]|uniref:Uncharacterized protein n=1 Tax=Aquatica leii TaxID=1421715 RepID=A0AAN7NY47_9COLE|nr:hypothetical protein RN001_014681 [Aquatica leii]
MPLKGLLMGWEKKRKATDLSTQDAIIYRRRPNVAVMEIIDTIEAIQSTYNTLIKNVSTNTKNEIKTVIDRLGKKIEYFNKTTIQNYLAQERWEKTEKMTIETESQTDAWKAHSKETKEIAIQTTQWTAEGKEMIDSVENVNTYEEWKQVAEEEWGDSVYIHTKIVEGHPLQETTGTSTLWVTEKEVEENTGLQLMIEKTVQQRFKTSNETDASIKRNISKLHRVRNI